MSDTLHEVIDSSVIEEKFNNLISRLQKEITWKAITEGGKLLQKYARESLLAKMPKAKTAKGKSKKTMYEQVHVINDKQVGESIVSVMNYLTKFFETGTDRRYIKEDHPKDDKHHKTYKKGEARGKITGLHYFREAREAHSDDVIEAISNVILEELKNEFDK